MERLLNLLLFVSLALGLAPNHHAQPGRPSLTGEPVALVGMVIPLLPAFSGCGGVLVPVVSADYEQQVTELVNAARLQNGLPPFKRVDLLDEAARYHATDMAQDRYFNHDSFDLVNQQLQMVCSWSTRIAGYYSPPGEPGWNSLAENIAGGQSDPQAAMNAWMNSSGHRGNILSISNWELGVGYSTGGPYGRYWVQDFGRRRGVYPLVINREDASTASRSVSLYIYGQGVFSEMRLRNDDGDWGNWQPYQAETNWELACGVGPHSVSVELRNSSGTVASRDQIDLTQGDCTPTLGDLPERLAFIYSQAGQRLLPVRQVLQPVNTGSPQPLAWTVSTQGDWFDVQPHSGTTPDTFAITPMNYDQLAPGTYHGTITLTVSDPPGATGSPQDIQLSLQVITDSMRSNFLPFMGR